MKLRTYPARYDGIIKTLDDLKRAVGWIPSPAFAVVRPQYPFGPIGAGRTNLISAQPLNGSETGTLTAATGTIVSTDSLASGLYHIDYVFGFGNSGDTLELRLVDSSGNLKRILTNIPVNAGSFQALWYSFSMPMIGGDKLLLFRQAAAGGVSIVATINWTYLSPYRSNDPLSLAQQRVQETEPTTLGQTSSNAPSSVAQSYSQPEGGDGGDGGGDSGL